MLIDASGRSSSSSICRSGWCRSIARSRARAFASVRVADPRRRRGSASRWRRVEQYREGARPHRWSAVRDLLPDRRDRGRRSRFSAVAARLPRRAAGLRPRAGRAGRHRGARLPAADRARADRRKARRSTSSRMRSARGTRRIATCALARMRQEGARIVSREMVAFEWLGEAANAACSATSSREFLRG